MKNILEEKYSKRVNYEAVNYFNNEFINKIQNLNHEIRLKGKNPPVPFDPILSIELSIILVDFLRESGIEIFSIDFIEIYQVFWLYEKRFKSNQFEFQVLNLEATYRDMAWHIMWYCDFNDKKRQFYNKFCQNKFRLLIKDALNDSNIKPNESAPRGFNMEVIKKQIESMDRTSELRNYVSHPKSYIEYINQYKYEKSSDKDMKVISLLSMNRKPMIQLVEIELGKIYKDNKGFSNYDFVTDFILYTLNEIDKIAKNEKLDTRTTKQKIADGENVVLSKKY